MRTLLIGGTGTVGREVAQQLAELGEDVIIMSRKTESWHPDDTQTVRGDLDQPASVRAAMRHVDRVFLLLAQNPNEAAQGLAAVAAARDASLSKIVYMSVRMPPFGLAVPHFAAKARVEQSVRESGLPFTILRPNNFFQNDLAFADVITQFGVYPQPIGSKGLARVDVRDVADAATIALTGPEHDGQAYDLNGPDLLTGDDIAAIYETHLGVPIRYAGDSLDTWASVVGSVLPEWLVHDLRIMYEKFQEYGLPSTPRADERLRRLLGRDPRGFSAFVAESFAVAALR